MLIDGHGRRVNYLRVSVTERCNFRCQYCMPNTPFSWVPHEKILTYEEMFLFIKIAIDEGINKIRITGGEPLVRPNLEVLIKMISDYKEDIDLALTTNAFFLENQAKSLYDAGLKRVNISLDSLKKDVILEISKIDALEKILRGIDKAQEVGLKIKLNMVPLRDVNDSEILDIIEFAKTKRVMVRFIEFMENSYADGELKGLNADEIKEIILKQYIFKDIGKIGTSPAHRYQLEDGYVFGIINPHRHDFCETCNRIRLSSEGLLIPCLYFDEARSIREAVKSGDIEKAGEILKTVLKNKPEKNRWQENEKENETSSRAFYQTGG
ncbi:MAG: GTP 3',8-cyclase MoaA [Campylobacteraceae bacterium]|nr:GTP 3',8-cyclase MoaA [Campylobacteraceae bacterium]